MKHLFIIMIGSLLFSPVFSENKHFVIIVPSYNNEEWCVKNLESIFSQDYPHFHVIYINDASTDKTGELVQSYIQKHALQDKCTYIENRENKKALHNIYHAVQDCDNASIVCLVDGDDHLAHSHVLSYLNEVYQDNEIWITYGQFKRLSGYDQNFQTPYDPRLQHIRTDLPNATHLKTFYAGLFKLINPAHLKYNNIFFPTTYDVAMMLPMLEMAGETHFKCLPEILYVYNDLNPINDHKAHSLKQFFYDFFIRNIEAYFALNGLIIDTTFHTSTLVLFLDSEIQESELLNKINNFKKSFPISRIILLIDYQNNHFKDSIFSTSSDYTLVWYENDTNPYTGRQRQIPLYTEWYNAILDDTESQNIIIATLSSPIPSSFNPKHFNKASIISFQARETSSIAPICYKEIQALVPLNDPCLFILKKDLFTRLFPGKFYINSFLSFRAALESCFQEHPSLLFSK